jgi:adenine-specific DNA glycosylase
MSCHRFAKEEIGICRRLMLEWYDANKRKLPWRDWHDVDTNIVAYRGFFEQGLMKYGREEREI